MLKPITLCITLASIAFAGTYTAASCSRDDVNAVINGPTHTAVDRDTINIPPGTCEWTAGIVIPAGIGISIIGAGTTDAHNPSGSGQVTTIIDNYTATPSYLFYFRPTYGASLSRVSSFVLSPKSGLSANSLIAPIAFSGTCTASGCPNIRVDHIVTPASPSWGGLTQPSSTIIVTNNVFGVMDHNSMYLDAAGQVYEWVNFNHSAWQGIGNYGDNSWASPNSFGTAQALYVESNYIEQKQGYLFPLTEAEGGVDGQGGGRVVCRFNTGVGLRSMCANHGTESNGRPRGGRQMEFYKNSMDCPSSAYPACWNNGMLVGAGVRSGSLIAVDNRYTGMGISNFANINEYRALQNINATWKACDGTGPYDHNDPTTYFSGTIATVSGSNPYTITVTGTPGWATGQWVNSGAPYSVHDSTIDNGAEITASGSNTVTVAAWTSIPFATGDSIQIRRAYACIDQPSRIGGSLLSAQTPTPNNSSGGWQNQTPDPVYEAADTGTAWVGPVSSNTARIIANRDYYAEVSQSAQTSKTSPFNGTVGTGYGTLANRPSTCTAGVGGAPGVGYWATDQGTWNQSGSGGQGRLYKCTATDTWSLAYTPYTYPHPLTLPTGGSVITTGGTHSGGTTPTQ